jgi:hypothetical protein
MNVPRIVEANCFSLFHVLCANDTPVNSHPNKLHTHQILIQQILIIALRIFYIYIYEALRIVWLFINRHVK